MQLLRKYSLRFLLGFIGILIASTDVHAGAGGGGGQVRALAVLDGSLHQIQPNAVAMVEDSTFFNPANAGMLDTPYAVQNQVTLMINEASTLYLRTPFSVTVKLLISYSDGKDTASVVRNFTVNYDTTRGVTYNSRSSLVFKGAHKVTVQVLSDSSNVTTWDPTTVLLVENQLVTTPTFVFSCTNTISNITVTPSSNDTADELPVSWNVVQGATQYDVEWAWVDSSALADTSNGYWRYGRPPYNPTLIFRNNATRITTTGTSYNIPLIYDNTGTLFIRVRPVLLGSGYVVTNATWSSDATPAVMGQYTFRGHERPLNWQSNISFAEEGKRKVVVQYYDGSLRSRQTVTKDNTTNTTIVGETYYDYQGRPAIQVMPSPTLGTIIKYTAGFNTTVNSVPYSQSNYDTLIATTQYSDIHADSMSNNAGASLYYSPNNPVATVGLNQFIPDAHDYPFTETEYTPDNTGRINRQGGAGLYHQLGTGHETRYFYGTPDQAELDALFGTEVGDKSHYFKNMVRDANGQYSVSYVDMHGRTIATALAGIPPAGMTGLPTYNRSTITETLGDPSTVSIQGQSMVSQKSLLVPMADTFYFNYSLTPDIFNDVNCQQQNICYTCRYDLTITITDSFNNLLQGGQPFVFTKNNFSLASLRNSCTDSAMNLSFSLRLPEGSYLVTKTLTVDPDVYSFYRDSIYLPNNSCTTIAQFIAQQKQVAISANTQCAPSCAACLLTIGTWSSFWTNYIQQAGLSPADTAAFFNEAQTAYNNLIGSCSALCQSNTDYNDIQSAMLADMTPPYGQYADTTLAANSDKYSIFYIKPKDSASYTPVFKYQQIVYHDANGNPDSVYLPTSGIMVDPNSLTQSQFVQYFQPSWAMDLLPYHPEYCRLQILQNNISSLTYDRQMESVDSYDSALLTGFINPTNNGSGPTPTTVNVDPFASQQLSALNDSLNSFETIKNPTVKLNMWQTACVMVKCDSTNMSSCPATFANVQNPFSSLCSGDADLAWRYFREMYLGAKQALFNKVLLANPKNCKVADSGYSSEPTASQLYAVNHQPQFSDYATALGVNKQIGAFATVNGTAGAVTEKAETLDTLASIYTANCNAYFSQWQQQMAVCTVYDTNDVKNLIIPALTALCRQACDSAHPYGASTLPTGQTYTFEGVTCSSFQDIINRYNAIHNITDALHCNAEVIISPLPYNNQPVYSNLPVYSRPSDCECSLINDLYNRFLAAAHGDPSFSAWLLRTQQISMADSDLTTLRSLCSNTTNSLSCRNLSKAIYLPPAMQCNSGPGCSSCQAIDSLYALYQQQYPGEMPSDTSDADTAQAQKNVLFQNFMNNRLGYNLQSWQYLQFMDTCAAHSADTVTSTGCVPATIAETFTSGGSDGMLDIRSTPDGGYVLAGRKILNGLQNAYLVRYNSVGQVQWAKLYSSPGGANFYKVKTTSDGGFVAVGGAYSASAPAGGVLVVKTDAEGTTQWEQNITFTSSARSDQGFDVIQTSDGGYAVAGDHNIGSGFTGPATMLCMKLDGSGNLLWANSVGNTIGNDGYGVAEMADTLMFVGRQGGAPFGNDQGFLVKVNESNGTILNSFVLRDSSQTASNQWNGLSPYLISSSPTGYQIGEQVSSDAEGEYPYYGFADISFNGTLLKQFRAGVPTGFVNQGSLNNGNIIQTSDGGWLIGEVPGQIGPFPPPDYQFYWEKVDSNGNVLWSKCTNLPGLVALGNMIQNPNGSYTALGAFGHYVAYGNSNISAMVLNLTSSGSAGCYDSAITFVPSTPNIECFPYAQSASALTISTPLNTISETLVTDTVTEMTCPGNTCYTVYNGPLLCGKSAPLLPPAANSITTCSDSTFFATTSGTALFNTYTDSLTNGFEQSYLNTCMQAYKHESFTVTHAHSEYHYTLYYYDQAGNLLKTVPPAGVQIDTDTNWIKQVEAAKVAGQVLVPAHTMATNYRYNTLNQVISQHSPDGSTSNFWYDRLGRLAVSQNRKQALGNQYSYTEYDTLGRIVQVGQLTSNAAITDNISRNDVTLLPWLANAASTDSQITVTSYDSSAYALQWIIGQRNLRNRVSWTGLFNSATDLANGGQNAAAATYYSYDILGNADTLVKDFGGGIKHGDVANPMNLSYNRFKKISYNFDLVSSKVNQVNYQHGHPDAFYHSYLYDAENRITNVQSSTDSVNWDNDAFYSYYAHGPLARTVLGQQQVQGINYVYTLQGWLKAINPAPYTGGAFTLRPDSSGNVVANNAYSLVLDYFNGDFNPISTAGGPDSAVATALGSDYRPLFNGNIGSMGANIRGLTNSILYNYQYDQLNRLVHMDGWYRNNSPWSSIAKTTDYQESVGYDPSGNILQYKRNGSNATNSLAMDSLTYSYVSGTNQLDHISDSVTAWCSTCNDITGQSTGNYQYDSIGELTADAGSGISNITWTVYGKIASISKPAHDSTILFTYDAGGNRVSKSVVHAGQIVSTWYVRDGQGNILSVYTAGDPSINGTDITQTELDVYGRSRLGTWRRNIDLAVSFPLPVVPMPLFGTGDTLIFTRGFKLFELTNHLENVLSTISDKRYGFSSDDSTVLYFNPDVVNANDYYPFGMFEPGRQYAQYNLGSYRFGFDGQEKIDELVGLGNHTSAEFWEYDTRLGRRWNLDPKPIVGITPYSAFNNNPIFNTDPLGDTTEPLMPRHPIDLKNHPSDIGLVPYNAIASLVNGGQSLLNKAGDYLDHPVEQLNDDAGAVGDFVVSQYNYFTKTPSSQIKTDVKNFFTNPDNYFHAAEDAFAIIAAGKFSIPDEIPASSKISVAEEFTLKGRLGNAATRSQIYDIGTELESRGYTITGGGGRLPEEYLKPIGGGRKGGSYLDLTATHPEYPTLRINTADTYVTGKYTARELFNARRIRKQIPSGEHLLLIPKNKL